MANWQPIGCEVTWIQPFASAVPNSTFSYSIGADLVEKDVYDSIRQATRAAVIRGFNGIAMGNGSEAAQARLQESISRGVEDAIIEGLNSIRMPREGEALEETMPLGDAESLSTQSKQGHLEAIPRLTPAPAPILGRLPAGALAHVPSKMLTEAFWDEYDSATVESSGWLVKRGQPQPLPVRGGFVVLSVRSAPGLGDVWKSGRLVGEAVQFARYFEDALGLNAGD